MLVIICILFLCCAFGHNTVYFITCLFILLYPNVHKTQISFQVISSHFWPEILCCHELYDLQNDIFIAVWFGLRTRAWGVWSGNETSAKEKKKWACVRRRRLCFFMAGRFYWLFALLNELYVSSPWCFFFMMRLCVYVAESRMFNLKLRDGIIHSSRRHSVALL